MTYDEACLALAYLARRYSDIAWAYKGDGSSLDGLEWHSVTVPPTLSDLEAALPLAQQQETAAMPIVEKLTEAISSIPSNQALTAASLVNALVSLTTSLGVTA